MKIRYLVYQSNIRYLAVVIAVMFFFSVQSQASSLVGAWTFNNGDGADSSGIAPALNGTLANGAFITSDPDPARSMVLNPNGGGVVLGYDPKLYYPGSITVQYWHKKQNPSEQWRYIVGQGGNGARHFNMNGGMVFELASTDSGWDPINIWRNDYPDPQIWHHVVVTYDGFDLYAYIDGVEVGRHYRGGTRSPNNTNYWSIGRQWNGGASGSWQSGDSATDLIDDVAIWNGYATADVVEGLYNGTYTINNAPIEIDDRIAPVITTTPVTKTLLGKYYSYDVNASGYPDPNYSLLEAPVNMTIDTITGLIEWEPDESQLGRNKVVLTASNSKATDTQEFVISCVQKCNAANLDEIDPVDQNDLSILAFGWLETDDISDIDADGNTDFVDFSFIGDNWQKNCAFANIYVSPNGNDSYDGLTAQTPKRTLAAAQALVRTMNQTMTGNIVVHLADGTYVLPATLAFDSSDSGLPPYRVIWMADNPGEVVISGGYSVPNTDWSVYDPAKSIYRANIGNRRARQIYVDGIRAVRARGEENPAGYIKTSNGYTLPDSTMASWANKNKIEVVGYSSWKSYRCLVSSIVGTSMTMNDGVWKSCTQAHDPYILLPRWIENAYELLDEPNEWYINDSHPNNKYLYYKPKPGEDMATVEVVVPVIETLVSGIGSISEPVRNITFDGIRFEYSGWMFPTDNGGLPQVQADWYLPKYLAYFPHIDSWYHIPANVRFRYAHNIEIKNCTFQRLGAVGLALERGSQNNLVTDNLFRDISASAVFLGGIYADDRLLSSDVRNRTIDNTIQYNTITSAACEYEGSVGIWVGYTQGTRLLENEIFNLPYTGISLGWGWNEVQTTASDNKVNYNDISNVMNRLTDGGGIYTLSRQDGSEIAYNDIYVVGGVIIVSNLGNHGVYQDHGSSYFNIHHNNINVNKTNNPGGACLIKQLGTTTNTYYQNNCNYSY